MRDNMGLYRGKRDDTSEWVEGYYSYASDGRGTELYLINEKVTGVHYPVIPKTVGQYTGLTDKNGNKIFEGDIIDCWSEGVNAQGAVEQRIDGLWIIYPAWQKSTFWGLCPSSDGSTSVEVIGNIHDNPELLKGGE